MAGGARGGGRRSGGSWGSFLAGLALGLAVAGLVWLQGGGRQAAPERPEAARPRADGAPRPRFDFYTILPELEVVIPDEGREPARDKPPAAARGRDAARAAARYVLQAGSFRRYTDADRLKARLALIGIEADIQKVSIHNGETWHRVRIGPFHSLREVDAVRARLREHSINAILLKIRG